MSRYFIILMTTLFISNAEFVVGKQEACSAESARQILCCRHREFWQPLASARSVEHASGLVIKR